MTLKKIAACIFSISIYSGYAGAFCIDCVDWTKVITLSGGVGWASAGETETIYSVPAGFANTYLNQGDTRVVGTGELFFALQSSFSPGILYQLGIAGGGSSEARVNGTISVNGVPTGSKYSYRIYQGRVLARGKLVADPNQYKIQPYITAAIGTSFNRSYRFNTSPLVNPVISPQYYRKNTTVGFTYSAGLGLEVAFNTNWHGGIGYEFADWGKSGLGQAITNPFTQYGPELRHVYAHRALASLTYLCS